METPTDVTYVDVTTEFFNAVKRMEPGKVKVTSHFDMLEGARALEMGNKRLDTGLLQLSKEDIAFDASQGQSLSTVVSTMNKLLVLYMTWLDGSSLSVTVLSCRYMLDFLHNYRKFASLRKASFVNGRLHPNEYQPANDTNSQLVNIVLRSFVIGLSKLIGFSLNVATNVLYDEEDLVTRRMNIDFLTQVSPQIAAAEIEEAELWLQTQQELRNDDDFQTAVNQLKLIKELVRLEHVLITDVNLFREPGSWGFHRKEVTLQIINSLKNKSFNSTPNAAFSRFVQLDCDNKHLPSKNVEIAQDKAYERLGGLIINIDSMLQHFTVIKNPSQLQSYLKYNIGFELAANADALTRGIFQLFFIRDDRSIAGSNESVGSLTTRLLDATSLCGNSIMDPSQWIIQNSKTPESTKAECLNKMAELLNDLEAASLHKMGSFGNNRCRQRQINNKNIVIWDSLHFNAETIESELSKYGIGDKLSPTFHDQPAFGISSYVFFEKLETMIDVALSGFEEDLYKRHEAPMIYWYVSELCKNSFQLVTERIVKINEGKLQSIQGLSKKIKNTKAGPKKEALKAEHSRMKEYVVPILTDNITYLEKCTALSQISLCHSTRAIATAIRILRAACDPEKETSYLASDEKLYKLRMKPWSSVGVPEMPSYSDYLQSFQPICALREIPQSEKKQKMLEHIETATLQLSTATDYCEKLIHNLENEQVLRDRTRIRDTCALQTWYNNLRKTCVAYKAQLSRVESSIDVPCQMKKVDGPLPYFPIYTVVQRS